MNHLTKMMEQVRKLKNDVGVPSLLDEAHKIMGNPLVMFSTEYKLVAHSEAITDDPFWNEIITDGIFSEETLRLFGDEGFIEDVANNPKNTFMRSDKIKYDRIAGKIYNKNNTFVAILLIVACKKPFEENDSIIFEAICKSVTREISKSEFYQEYEQAHQEAIIKSLIDGSYNLRRDIPQVGIIYDSLESNLYVVVADISQCNQEHTNTVYFRDLFKQTTPKFKYAVYSNYVVMIISTNEDMFNVSKELKELIKIFEQNNIYAGISSRFENLFELQKYYDEALDMLQFVLESRCDQRIFPHNAKSVEVMEQIEALENGAGIQYFLNIGAEIFGNPLLFHDMELNLLAYTENMEISDPIWEELITYGTSSNETIELFRTEGFIDIMDNTKGGALLISEKIKYDRISWRIYNNDNIRIGCTSIVNTIKPFSEDELVLFGAFSQKFSKEVGKIEFYNNYGQVYSRTIINRLISGKIDDYTFYSEDVGNLYDSLMENLYLVVVDMSQCESEQVNLTYFRDLFNWQGTVNRYAIYADYIIIIISIDSVSLTDNDKFYEISKIFEQKNIYAGISSCFGDIYELQSHYNEAVNALHAGIRNNRQTSSQRIFQHDIINNVC